MIGRNRDLKIGGSPGTGQIWVDRPGTAHRSEKAPVPEDK